MGAGTELPADRRPARGAPVASRWWRAHDAPAVLFPFRANAFPLISGRPRHGTKRTNPAGGWIGAWVCCTCPPARRGARGGELHRRASHRAMLAASPRRRTRPSPSIPAARFDAACLCPRPPIPSSSPCHPLRAPDVASQSQACRCSIRSRGKGIHLLSARVSVRPRPLFIRSYHLIRCEYVRSAIITSS
jgi:hypothetical protein